MLMPFRLYGSSGLALLLAAFSGCASLDARPDVQRAGDLVQGRSGVMPVWNEPWMVDASQLSDPQGGGLSVQRAVALALQNNRGLRADVEMIAAARADLVQAGLLPNPVLGFTLRFPEEGSTFVGVSIVQQLTAIWLRPTHMRAADARLNNAVLALSDRALRLAADVKQSHARICFAQQGIALTLQNLEMVQQASDAIAELVQAGEGTTLSANRVKQQLLHLQADLITQEHALQRERRTLLALIGFPEGDADFAIAADAHDNHLIDLSWTENEVIERSRTQRLEVAASRELVKAAYADLRAEELSRFNDVEAGIDIEREMGETAIGPMVGVSLPIFDFNQARIARASADGRRLVALHESALHSAIAQARLAYVDVVRTRELLQLQGHEALKLAEQNRSVFEQSFSAGQDDITVLLEAQREVIEARLTLNELQRRQVEAMYELEYAVGGSLRPPSSQ